VLHKNVVWWIYVTGNYWMYLGFHVKSPLFLSVFNQFWSFLKDFHRSPHIKFHRNFSCGSCAETDTKLTGTSCDYVDATKNSSNLVILHVIYYQNHLELTNIHYNNMNELLYTISFVWMCNYRQTVIKTKLNISYSSWLIIYYHNKHF